MIIPSIDLQSGKAVQLVGGREKMLERDDPVSVAKEFYRYGELAVIDLDAALGQGDNGEIIKKLCRRHACRVGGGIRSVEKAVEVLSWGAEKIIVGTRAFGKDGLDRDFLEALSRRAGRDRVILAVDTYGNDILIRGWRERTGISREEVISAAEPFVSGFLFTQVEREGRMQGIDLQMVEAFRRSTELNLTAAGGITTAEEIEKLSGMDVDAQLGMAVYSGKLDLADAFAATVDWSRGLIPTIAVDTGGQVLMLAYSSRESLSKAFSTGKAWYFSRSRCRLWMKGEESGNVQELVRIRHDCDRDALLMTVRPSGPSCHKGSYSCFGRREFSLEELYDVIQKRLENPDPASYSASLSLSDVHEKIREESEEFLEAVEEDHLIWEAADLIFFMMLKLARHGISPEQVLGELKRRRRAPKSVPAAEEKQ